MEKTVRICDKCYTGSYRVADRICMFCQSDLCEDHDHGKYQHSVILITMQFPQAVDQIIRNNIIVACADCVQFLRKEQLIIPPEIFSQLEEYFEEWKDQCVKRYHGRSD